MARISRSFCKLGLAASLSIATAILPAIAQFTDTPASHAVIMDHATGTILFSKDGDQAMIPASMTKMMTAYLVFEMIERGEVSLTDRLTVSADAWRRGGFPSGTSTMGLKPNDTPTIEELLHGVIIMSGNDACIVLAQGLAGSEEAFARQMTELAHEIGMKTAAFKNTTGLEAIDHVVSAEDLALLARLTIENYPQYYEWYDDPAYTWREYTQANRNPLLGSMDGADGLKTGHLSASGYGLTGSAIRDGIRRTIVINGLESSSARAAEAERLMRIAFQSYELKIASPENIILPDQDVWLGQSRTVPVSLSQPVEIAGHKRGFERAKTELVLKGPILAPIAKGDVVGDLEIQIEGQSPISVSVIAEADVPKLGFFGRALEGLSRMISS